MYHHNNKQTNYIITLNIKIMTQGVDDIYFIVQDGDFTAAELVTLDAISPHPLSDARWNVPHTAFIVSFISGYDPYPLLSNHTEYTQAQILPIVNAAPWVVSF